MLANAVSDRETVLTVYAEYDAVREKMAALSYGALTLPELLELQSRREQHARSAPAVDHRLLAEMQARTTPKEIGGSDWADVVATRLRISRREARRRISEAEDLGPRTALTGEPLGPMLPATAQAQARGDINAEHVAIIRRFFARPPIALDAGTQLQIDADLARVAAGNGPDTLQQVATRIATLLNQDGDEPSDAHRARRRGVTLHDADTDGMSRITGFLDPITRAHIDAVLATWAAEGRCNPDDENPCVDSDPDQDTKDRDIRSIPQRNHDALAAMTRSVIASGQLGQHNGLPVTVVVTTTLQDLEAGTGIAVTGGGTTMSMSDVIRVAAHSHHYLAIFDKHTAAPLYLGRTRRLATRAQRLVLYARDRGCTRPGCTAPAYHSQAHHARQDYVDGGETNITDLGLACGPDNRLATESGWTTSIRAGDGRVEWTPPPLLDTGQDRVNEYHHPENLLRPPEDHEDDP